MKTDLNEKYVSSLLARLKGINVNVREPSPNARASYDGPQPVACFAAGMMSEVRGFEVSPLDQRTMLEVPDGPRYLCIEGEGFSTLRKLAAEFIAKCELTEVVSQDFVEDRLFDYRISAFKSDDWSCPIQHMALCVSGVVEECSFSFPLSGSRGNRAFFFCGVDFRPDSNEFKEWLKVFRESTDLREHERAARQRMSEEWKDNYLQCMWASISLTAEPKYAKQVALRQVTEATHLLRALCVAGYHPTRHVGLVPGAAFAYGHLTLGSIGGRQTYFSDPAARTEILWFGEEFLGELNDLGLKRIDLLYAKESRNEMEDLCLLALSTLGSVAGMSDVSDKVVYGCTALDLLYSRKEEPILATMPKRLAIEIGSELEERKAIVAVIKAVYGLRSGRVHGGQAAELNTRTLDFFRYLFYLAGRLPFVAERFSNQSEYINSLEDRMLGGQEPGSSPRRARPIR